ncbi:hypothetical protein PRNP1_010816 [Phytophthora ramorum]
MKLLHHLLASAVCVAALVATTTPSVSAQADDVSYSGSGSDENDSRFLRGPDGSDGSSELAFGLDPGNDIRDLAGVEDSDFGNDLTLSQEDSDDENDQAVDTEDGDDDSSVEIIDSEEEGAPQSPTDPPASPTRQLKGPTGTKTPSKPAASKSPPTKPTNPLGSKPSRRPKHTPTPTPTVTPAATLATVTDTPTVTDAPTVS